MSRIDDLIRELCPNGVKHKKLGEIVEILDSQRRPVTKSQRQSGKYPYYGANGIQDFVSDYIFDGFFILLGEDGSVINKDNSPVLNWATGKIWVNNHAHILAEKSGEALLRYIYFVLQTIDVSQVVKGNIPKITQQNLRAFRVPVPPLAVQEEIVRVLDSFTSLEAELEAELEERRKQYEYYRARLLGDSADTVMRLGDIFDMRAGTHISTVAISQVSNETQRYPCFGGNGIRGYVDRFTYDGDVVFIGRQGALCGNVHRMSGKFYATEHAVVVTPKIKVDMSWAFHKLTQMNLNQFKTKSAQPGLAVGRIKELTLRCPPFSEQHRIASMLDGFDDLVSNLSSGLPAEIAARRQQYEYYRDRLLTFKELTV